MQKNQVVWADPSRFHVDLWPDGLIEVTAAPVDSDEILIRVTPDRPRSVVEAREAVRHAFAMLGEAVAQSITTVRS